MDGFERGVVVRHLHHRPRHRKDGKLAELGEGRAQRRAKVGFQNPSPSAPPSALTPIAVQLRPVAGARRAIPRRIHGVRLAITATARSERRIAVRGPGVGVEASSASTDPDRGPRRSTASSCQVPGTPRTRRCRGPRSPCRNRQRGHGRCGRRGFRRRRPGRGCARRCVLRSRRRHRRAVRTRRCGCRRGSRCPASQRQRARLRRSRWPAWGRRT